MSLSAKVETMRQIGLLLVALTLAAQAELYPKLGTLNVVVTGITSSKGQILVCLYDKKDRWMKPERAAATKVLDTQEGDMSVELEVPLARRYAASVYHDENSNGKLDTGFPIPKPVEPVGASYHTKNSIPRYYECSFRFQREPMTITVPLRRP